MFRCVFVNGRSWVGFSALVAAVFTVCGVQLNAQQAASNEDLRELRGISSPKSSPDGKKIILEVQDSTANGGQYHLWLLNTDGGPYRQLTGKQDGSTSSERNASFFPDGSTFLYQEGSHLFRMSLQTDTSVELKIPNPLAGSFLEVDSYGLAPDGKTLAILASDPSSGTANTDAKERRDIIRIPSEETPNRLYLVDVASLKAQVVPNLTKIDAVTWNAQSDRLLVLAHEHAADLGYSTIAWVVDKRQPTLQKRLRNIPSATFRAEWFHNGKGLVLFAQTQMDTPIGTSDLYTLDLAGDHLKHLDAGIKDSTLSPRVLIVSKDDKDALISITHRTRITIGKVDLGTGEMKVLDLGQPVIADFSQVEEAGTSVFIGSSSISPPSVYTRNSLDAPSMPVEEQPQIMPSNWSLARSQIVTWRRDGLEMEGLLYMPTSASNSYHVPLIVMGHGGPSGQFTDTYTPLINLLVAQGWAVFCPNPRGSTGYGLAFQSANKHDLGNGDFLDIMAGIEEVSRTHPIDQSRMAFIGHSYGGEMAAFVEGKTDRFKAVVVSAPVIDAISELGTEEDPFPDTWFVGLKPWRSFNLAWKQSPLAYVGTAKTPILLLQGSDDTDDPPGQSKEFYHALRMEGVPVQLLFFPRETHSSLGREFYGYPTREPWHGTMLRKAVIDFIRSEFAKSKR